MWIVAVSVSKNAAFSFADEIDLHHKITRSQTLCSHSKTVAQPSKLPVSLIGKLMRPTAATHRSSSRVAGSQRCIAIINPAGAAGRAGKLWDKLSSQVLSQLSSHGFTVEQCFTTREHTGAQLAWQAAAAGVDVVLAVGGDGTIHEVGSASCCCCCCLHLCALQHLLS